MKFVHKYLIIEINFELNIVIFNNLGVSWVNNLWLFIYSGLSTVFESQFYLVGTSGMSIFDFPGGFSQ